VASASCCAMFWADPLPKPGRSLAARLVGQQPLQRSRETLPSAISTVYHRSHSRLIGAARTMPAGANHLRHWHRLAAGSLIGAQLRGAVSQSRAKGSDWKGSWTIN
jgi:hypothetical protein